jgi:hypothetical protein
MKEPMLRLSEPFAEWRIHHSPTIVANSYAILDAARDPRIYARLRTLKTGLVSLYRGQPEEALAPVAPYLISLAENAELRKWILSEGWGNSWGVFMTATAGIDDLRQHFRHFLLVRDADGKRLYFRFYDPRVLRVYLPTCTESELHQLFGPVESYFMESEDGRSVLEYRLSPR